MNNNWIRCSKITNVINMNDIAKQTQSYNHEKWLDRLNLHETSWMLFVNRRNRFGWPGTEHE